MQNPLNSKVFQDELDFKTLENILETLDHVTPKKVTRSDFDVSKWNFLIETWEDKFGKQYDLFLPEDLVHGELVHLIDFLSQKFGIENYAPYERIVTQTKVMVGLILRWLWENEGEKYLQELAEKYSLSPKFIARLQSQKKDGDKISFSKAKEMIKSIKSKRNNDNDEKIWENPDDMVLWFEELKDLFWKEFDLTFFRKWINMLRLSMLTITQAEQEEKIKYCEENWFEKEIRENWKIIYKKWNEIIVISIDVNYLDNEERLLRDKIWIDNLKRKLRTARKTWNQEKINEVEYNTVITILKTIKEYMYQFTEKHLWDKINKLSVSKEIFCVWFSTLWHAFLSELWIKHSWLEILRFWANKNVIGHSALEVLIWWIKYYFDPTLLSATKLYEIKHLNSSYWPYKSFLICDKDITQNNFILEWNTEEILLSQIFNNRWKELSNLWKYKESLKMYEKSIKLNSNNYSAISGLFFSLIILWKYKKAINIIDFLYQLNPLQYKYYNNIGNLRKKINKGLFFIFNFIQIKYIHKKVITN